MYNVIGMLKTRLAFTLVELLMVITLIGILTTFGVMTYRKSQQTSRDGKRKADIETIRSALEIYRYDNSNYPTSLNSLLPNYISAIPTDPKNPVYLYSFLLSPVGCDNVTTRCLSYSICAGLEVNTTQAAGCGSCGSGITCSYKVTNP